MMRWTRRFLWLALLMMAGVALATVARRRAADAMPAPAAAPSWPPFEPAPPEPAPVQRFATSQGDGSGGSAGSPGAGGSWVLPVDGECPPGYPIKANDNSGIYHVPGGRSYERTKAERCYVDAESAAADGYRAAKA